MLDNIGACPDKAIMIFKFENQIKIKKTNLQDWSWIKFASTELERDRQVVFDVDFFSVL